MSEQIKKVLDLVEYLYLSTSITCMDCGVGVTEPLGRYGAAETFIDQGWVLKDEQVLCMECDKKTM